jgi:hypothetical protein
VRALVTPRTRDSSGESNNPTGSFMKQEGTITAGLGLPVISDEGLQLWFGGAQMGMKAQRSLVFRLNGFLEMADCTDESGWIIVEVRSRCARGIWNLGGCRYVSW